MEKLFDNLQTPEECDNLANIFLELSKKARNKAVELRASKHVNISQVEKELLKAIYAYEEQLSKKNGRRTRANRTWQMVKKYGIIGAAERAVNRDIEPMGFTLLVEMGLEDLTFESVIKRFPESFNPHIVELAIQKLDEYKNIG